MKNKKNHRSTDLAYVRVHLVSRSHLADPIMAYPANMYGICLLFFFLLQQCRCGFKPTKDTSRNSLAKDETSGPFMATCSSVRKNDGRIRRILKWYWCCVAIHFRLKFQSSSKKPAYVGFLLLYLMPSVSKSIDITFRCF